MASPEDCPPPSYEMVVSGNWNPQSQPLHQQSQQQHRQQSERHQQDQQRQHRQHQQPHQQQRRPELQSCRTRDVHDTEVVEVNSNIVEQLLALQTKYFSLEVKYRDKESELTDVRRRNIELVQKCSMLENELNKLRNETRGRTEDQTNDYMTNQGAVGAGNLTSPGAGPTENPCVTPFLAVNKGSNPSNIVIEGNMVDFTRYSTVSILRIIPATLKVKVWYEVRILEYTPPIQDNYLCIGWAPELFRSSDSNQVGVGDPVYPVSTNGYGLRFKQSSKNPYEADLFVRGAGMSWVNWGCNKMSMRGGTVIGVALDRVNMKIMFSMNGKWDKPMGVAYPYVSPAQSYFPAITACQVRVKVNCEKRDFSYGPPDDSFVAVGGRS